MCELERIALDFHKYTDLPKVAKGKGKDGRMKRGRAEGEGGRRREKGREGSKILLNF